MNQSTGGFIHLFLPLSMSAASTSGSVATPKPWPTVASAPPETSYGVPEPRKQSKKKSAKKKMRLDDDGDQQISWKKKKKKKMKDLVEKSVASSTESSNNRLINLMQDDGIPPLLNSLSANETQVWSRWLRCTLCLKVLTFLFFSCSSESFRKALRNVSFYSANRTVNRRIKKRLCAIRSAVNRIRSAGSVAAATVTPTSRSRTN